MAVLNRPPVRLSLSLLVLAGLVAGCADTTGLRPGSEPQARSQNLHTLSWQSPATTRFSMVGRKIGSGPLTGVAMDAGSNEISLEQDTVQFWAVRGESRSVQINYRVNDDVSQPFLRFTTSDPAFVPDQGEVAQGDSVLITLSVNPATLKVSLEPTGLQFGEPAQLQLWYGGAGGDLNGDGVVDETDARIEHDLLGLWYREAATDPWTPIPAQQSLSDKSFISSLLHFCEYEVSFLDYAVSW